MSSLDGYSDADNTAVKETVEDMDYNDTHNEQVIEVGDVKTEECIQNENKENNEYENELDEFIQKEFGDSEETFLTSVRIIDDSGRGEGVGKKTIPKDEEDLGIYEDTDDSGDQTDSEQELERLRAEKLQREEEKQRKEQEEKERLEAEIRAAKLARVREEEEKRLQKRKEEELEAQRVLEELARQLPPERTVVTPRLDIHRSGLKTWSDPRLIQGLSLKELYWKSFSVTKPMTTSMATQIEHSINASRLALESREAMFRRAMSLLSTRCTSVRQDSDEKLSLGAQMPKYFYVTQDKPVPMEPLKAWRGYNGNIYFEPININPLHKEGEEERAKSSIPRSDGSPRQRQIPPKPRTAQDKENKPAMDRSESRQTNKSSVGSRRSSNRPVVILDKHTVLTKNNESIQEDIVWLETQESTGSLAIRPKTYPEHRIRERERDLQYNKERIRKGSVAHKLFVENRSRQGPKLSVSGGKFTPPNSLSPLLRTQTQYSLSNNRLTTNSPDPYHLNESKLPPLDQARVSVKRDGNQASSKMPYHRSVTITDDMKPFVKYSPDVVAKFSHQTNIC